MDEKLFELDAGELLAAAIVELKTASRKAGFGPNIERTRGILKLLERRIREFEEKHRCPECGNLKNGHSCPHCERVLPRVLFYLENRAKFEKIAHKQHTANFSNLLKSLNLNAIHRFWRRWVFALSRRKPEFESPWDHQFKNKSGPGKPPRPAFSFE